MVRIVVLRPLPEVGGRAPAQRGRGDGRSRPRPLTVEERARRCAAPPRSSRCRPTGSTRALLDAAGDQLQVVANFAVGYDNIDLDACRARGVAATNTPDTLVETTADLAFALILAACAGSPRATG